MTTMICRREGCRKEAEVFLMLPLPTGRPPGPRTFGEMIGAILAPMILREGFPVPMCREHADESHQARPDTTIVPMK